MTEYRGLTVEDTREAATDEAISQLEARLGASREWVLGLDESHRYSGFGMALVTAPPIGHRGIKVASRSTCGNPARSDERFEQTPFTCGEASAMRVSYRRFNLGFVRKVAERRSGKTKTGEERPGSRSTLLVVNEHSEPVFNVA